MNIKQILKDNNITQDEFAEYLGVTREGLNKNLNHCEPSKSMIDSLKLLVARKRGVTFDINLNK